MLRRFFKRSKTANDKTTSSGTRDASEIQSWILINIGKELGVPGESLDPTDSFTSYGLDSIAGFTLTLDLAEWLDRELPASLFWEYPTVAELAQHLAKEG
ncbi:MAG: acyl carrier protein [Woeseia sp.]|nr:acyl carrier protein [Gammaproteobacteria bacterium]NNE60741.1 acyl carrier protein [Woeseia sp.]NNL50165.1 acyl carrier protein [Woeseiaceae bacterium]